MVYEEGNRERSGEVKERRVTVGDPAAYRGRTRAQVYEEVRTCRASGPADLAALRRLHGGGHIGGGHIGGGYIGDGYNGGGYIGADTLGCDGGVQLGPRARRQRCAILGTQGSGALAQS